MKTKFLTLITILFLGYGVQAACSVTTSCGTFYFPNATSISVNSSTENGQAITIVKDQNKKTLRILRSICVDVISMSCEGVDADFTVCDIFPYFPDCNENE